MKHHWAHYANAIVGSWLLASPASFHYGHPAMAWNDGLCGAALVLLGLLSIRHHWARWAACLLGLWLMFAPLVFWSPTAAGYINDTVAGTLAVAFSVLVPGEPGRRDLPGASIPPGWTYNPSAYAQRAPIIGVAFLSFYVARYMAAYQLGHISSAWDPFFGKGTSDVLRSDVSRAFPVSDAGLGAVSYLVEALSGFMGDSRRWRTMPWMVLLFGVLIVPLGVISIGLVILQPLAVGAWCTLCLATAVLMLVMISPALDEVIATLEFLGVVRRRGLPFWRTFWQGAELEGDSSDASPKFSEVLGFVKAPWTLVASCALGAWLMASPTVFGIGGAAANGNYVAGPLLITFAVIAVGEVSRAARFVNALIGLWLVASPFVLAGGSPAYHWASALTGLAAIALSLPKGHIANRYGKWDRFVV